MLARLLRRDHRLFTQPLEALEKFITYPLFLFLLLWTIGLIDARPGIAREGSYTYDAIGGLHCAVAIGAHNCGIEIVYTACDTEVVAIGALQNENVIDIWDVAIGASWFSHSSGYGVVAIGALLGRWTIGPHPPPHKFRHPLTVKSLDFTGFKGKKHIFCYKIKSVTKRGLIYIFIIILKQLI